MTVQLNISESLNDALLQGLDVTNRLLGVLIRFRKHTISLVTDIREKFMQVHHSRSPDDVRSVRFLWYPDDDITQQPIDCVSVTSWRGLLAGRGRGGVATGLMVDSWVLSGELGLFKEGRREGEEKVSEGEELLNAVNGDRL